MLNEMRVISLDNAACVIGLPYRGYDIVPTMLSQTSGGGTILRVFDTNGVDIVPEFIDGHFAATSVNVRRSMAMIDFKIEGFKKAPLGVNAI